MVQLLIGHAAGVMAANTPPVAASAIRSATPAIDKVKGGREGSRTAMRTTMENLHEQIKAYIPSGNTASGEYMRNPATPNAAQGIMAMVECLNMLQGAGGPSARAGMTEADAEAWAAHMVNEDGTTGPHGPMEQTTALAKSMGLPGDQISPWCWWVTMNMMYSDYRQRGHPLRRQHGGVLRELAQAFLFDKDGPGPRRKAGSLLPRHRQPGRRKNEL